MIKLRNLIRRWKIQLHNLTLFLIGCARFGVPPWEWRRAWQVVYEEHEAETRRAIWELKKQGKVRHDKEGRLYWVKD